LPRALIFGLCLVLDSGTHASSAQVGPQPDELVLSYEENPDTKASSIDLTVRWEVAETRTVYIESIGASSQGRPNSKTVDLKPPGGQTIVPIDPCAAPIGDDSPGTAIDISVAVAPGGRDLTYLVQKKGGADSSPWPRRTTITLGPDTTKPVIRSFNPSVRPGTVQKGQRIDYEILASDEKTPGRSWQTGVKSILVTANDMPIDMTEGPSEAPKCAERRPLLLKGNYQVTRDPPPTIELCAIARDYASPEPNSAKTCLTYTPTDKQAWNGTIRSTWNGAMCTGTQEGTITLEVAGTAVTGSSATAGRQNCPSIPFSQGGPQTAQVQGEFTGGEFRLNLGNISGIGDGTSGCWGVPRTGPVLVKVTAPGRAEARFEGTAGTERYGCAIELRLEGGGEPVG
jgi:hypothetical protein